MYTTYTPVPLFSTSYVISPSILLRIHTPSLYSPYSTPLPLILHPYPRPLSSNILCTLILHPILPYPSPCSPLSFTHMPLSSTPYHPPTSTVLAGDPSSCLWHEAAHKVPADWSGWANRIQEVDTVVPGETAASHQEIGTTYLS